MIDLINLSSEEFSNEIHSNKDAVILDVRTPQEYNEGHIPSCLLIDIYHPTFQSKILSLSKDSR
jgi:rhodanese-related sulfurtransferase